MDERISLPAWFTLGLVCLVSLSFLLWGALTDSAIMDELAHIPAGYAYVSQFDYRLNPEHPPLVKALAALPLLALHPAFPTESAAWRTEVNSQWAMGDLFLYQSGNDADRLIRWARIVPILLTIFTVIFLYRFARDLLDEWWALVPATLFALSPIVLAHGHYVTTDIGAAFGTLIGLGYFLAFLKIQSQERLFFAGLALGAAELTKFSTVLLVPYLFLLVVIYAFLRTRDALSGSRTRDFLIRLRHLGGSYLLILFVAYAFVVYPVYFLFTYRYPQARQTSDAAFILGSFSGGPTPAGQICNPMRCLADLDIAMTKNAFTRPLAEYALGVLMVFQRSSGGNTSYFLDRVSAAGSREYFPVVYGLKETLPALIFILLAVLYALYRGGAAIRAGAGKGFAAIAAHLEVNFTAYALAGFIALYWAASIHSPLNIGVRHLLPTIPLTYLLATLAWKRMLRMPSPEFFAHTKFFLFRTFAASLKYVFAFLLGFWFLTETALAAPHFLSYFNELGGGTWGGYRYVTDSNYDWGQDLLRLKDFVAARPDIRKIAVDYFGGGNPKYALGEKEADWSSSKGNPSAQGIHWLAVSANTLQSAIEPLAPGQTRDAADEYRWLTALRPPTPGLGEVPAPDYRAGTSLFVYHLP